jgi:hypothetical protein
MAKFALYSYRGFPYVIVIIIGSIFGNCENMVLLNVLLLLTY